MSEEESERTPAGSPRRWLRRIGLALGPAAGALLYLILPEGHGAADGSWAALEGPARATVGMGAWMAIWWMTEAIPIYATALLPLALFPFLGIASGREAAAPYGHELIFLFMGGFLLALSMERWGLHRRIAFRALRLAGTRPAHVVGGIMIVSAVLSMWVSNTATAIMMLPVAVSLAGNGDRPEDRRFAICLFLGIAYGCTIGGIATPVGTPPNLFLLSFAKSELGVEISFVRWMAVGLPLALLFLPCAWWLLTRWLFHLDDAPIAMAGALREEHEAMGPLGSGERSAALAFGLAASLWLLRPLLAGIEISGHQPFAGLTDTSIAIGAALTLFLLPGNREVGGRALDWNTALRLPWGILILFGGGLSLAAAIRANGVDLFLAHQVTSLQFLPPMLVVVAVVAMVVFLTELTSNMATCATFVPLLAGVAPGLGMDPLLLAVPAAIAASFAFMLPVATPPNAIIFGSGKVRIADMVKVGIVLNLIGIIVTTVLFLTWGRFVFGI